jgi:hypothetical protein
VLISFMYITVELIIFVFVLTCRVFIGLFIILMSLGVRERGPLSLVRITEELLEWKSSGSESRKARLTAVGIRWADHTTPSFRKSWH